MEVLNTLNEHYPMRFDKYEELRDGGSTSYAVFSGRDKYFLRVIKPAFFDTAVKGADIQAFLHSKGFPVPHIICTKNVLPYAQTGGELYVLYEYIEGEESDPEQDAEAIGALVGKLHRIMKDYRGGLVKRDRRFYIGRYIDFLNERIYRRANEFSAYGDDLWEKVKDLPRGYAHGDIYCGNILKTPDDKLVLLDFDTSCEGFPMYDAALICDMTEYFKYDDNNYNKSNRILTRFLPEYSKYSTLSKNEINAFHDLIAMQHFATQATIMEIFGIDCLSDSELDGQLEWLYRWRAQSAR
jgi:Ser/Thr protein kinase RdoA (MazF antagonist)